MGPRSSSRAPESLAKSRWRVALSIAALAAVGSSGCLIELDRRLACGDGYVDALAGEQCDPADPLARHESACVDAGLTPGVGGCDPETCQLVITVEQCAVCGDNVAEGAEICDGTDLRGQPCAGATCLSDCTYDISTCPTCGNGQYDPGRDEECDASELCRGASESGSESGEFEPEVRDCVDPDDPLVVNPIPCSTLPVLAVGVSTTQYARGSVNTAEDCEDACFFSRRECDFCGNGALEPQYDDIDGAGFFTRAPEVCEVGPAGDNTSTRAECAQYCTPGSAAPRVLCDLLCEDSCATAKALHPDAANATTEELGCCLAAGEACGGPGQLFPCCGESPEFQACQLSVGGAQPTFRCAPFGPPVVELG